MAPYSETKAPSPVHWLILNSLAAAWFPWYLPVTDSLLCFISVSLRWCHFRDVVLHTDWGRAFSVHCDAHLSPFHVRMLSSVTSTLPRNKQHVDTTSVSSGPLIEITQQHSEIFGTRLPAHFWQNWRLLIAPYGRENTVALHLKVCTHWLKGFKSHVTKRQVHSVPCLTVVMEFRGLDVAPLQSIFIRHNFLMEKMD